MRQVASSLEGDFNLQKRTHKEDNGVIHIWAGWDCEYIPLLSVCIRFNELISKHLREKMCLPMAPITPVALIRIQTPSFSRYHGPNIDLVCDKDMESMKTAEAQTTPNEWDFYSSFKLCLFSLAFCFIFLSTTTILSVSHWGPQAWIRNNILQNKEH